MKKYELSEADREIVLKHLREQYESNCELCGKASEEAEEAKDLYKKVLAGTIAECQDDIIGYYREMYEAVAVHGGIYKCYKSMPDLIEMIDKIIEE